MTGSPSAAASAVRGVACPITWRRDWTSCLFSFRTTRPDGLEYAPGQFVRLGVTGSDGAVVWRAYSIASPPAADELEFYSIVVPDGPFTQPLSRRSVGDAVLIDPTVYGLLRTERFSGGRALWLLATGTGIAPFRAMVGDANLAGRFDDVVVVHSVRRPEELAYRAEFAEWAAAAPGRHYHPTLTVAAASPDTLIGRITTSLGDGTLERAVGLSIDADAARVMLCGNPSMIREARAMLAARGMTPVRREVPGQFIVENFW